MKEKTDLLLHTVFGCRKAKRNEIGNNITEKCLKCVNTTGGNNHDAGKKRWREMSRNEDQWKGDKGADGQRVNMNSRKKGNQRCDYHDGKSKKL